MQKLLKRASAVVLAILLIVPTNTSINIVNAAVANNTTVLLEENFEKGSIDPKVQTRGTGVAFAITKQSESNNELTISGRNEAWKGLQIPINDTAGKSVTVSMKVRSANTQSVLGIQYKQDGKTSTTYEWIKNSNTTLDSYVELSGTHPVPSDAKEIFIFLQSNDQSSVKLEDIMVDDIKITVPISVTSVNTNTVIEDFEGSNHIATARSSTIQVVEGAGVNGSKALYVTGRSQNWQGVNFNANTYAGTKIEVTAQVKNTSSSSNSSMKISLQFDNPATQYKTVASGNTGGSDYVTLTGTYEIPADVTNITLYVEASDNSNFYLDNFTITRLTEPVANPGTNPGTNPGPTPGNNITSISEDFEGTQHIALSRSATLQVIAGAGVNGSKALFVSGRSQNWQGVNFNAEAFAGQKVKVTAQVKSTSPSMKISAQIGSGDTASYATVVTGNTGGNDYVTLTGTYDIPAGITPIFLYIEAQGNNDFYVDNFSIVKENVVQRTIEEDIVSLKDFFATYASFGASAGVAIPASALNDTARMQLVTKHFNSVTFENEMKPDAILGSSPTLDSNGNLVLNFRNADRLMDYIWQYNQDKSEADQIRVRGHVLLWHSQTPTWFFKEDYNASKPYVSKEVMLERIDYYFKTVIEHYDGPGSKYAGIIYAWDVVNEQIDNGGLRRSDGNGGTSNYWQVFQGDDSYVIEAFRLANKYAPSHIKLFYNDYGETDPVKAAAICKLLQKVIEAEGVRIDGMGMQGHYNMQSPTIEAFENAVRAYASLGLEIQITELDLQSSFDYNGNNKEIEYTKQAYRYKALFDKMYELKQDGINITNVTFWGTHDGASWLQSASFVGGGADGTRKQVPLLFDDQYKAKPAFYAIVDPSQLEPFTSSVIGLYSANDSWVTTPKTTYTSNGTEVSFQTIWMEGNLKVRVQVKDTTAAEGDQILVYVDEANSKSSSANINTYTLDRNNTTSTEQGYVGILNIPLSEARVGRIIGFDVAVMNNGKKLSWNDLRNTQATTSKYYGELTLKPYAEINYGTPIIDGNLDNIWQSQNALPLTIKSGNPVATASVRAMWDDEYLYVFADIIDPVLSKANTNAWEQDSFEIFVDQNNGKTTTYQPDDSQYRINFDNQASFNGTKSNANNLHSATTRTDNGYIVEAAIKWTDVTPAVGKLIGVDFQVNDDTGNGKRGGTYNWFDEKGLGYANPSVFGTVTLVNSNTGSTGETGNTGDNGNTDVSNNTGNSGNTANTGNTDNNNTGITDNNNTGNTGNTDNNNTSNTENNNTGNTGNTDNNNTGNTGNTSNTGNNNTGNNNTGSTTNQNNDKISEKTLQVAAKESKTITNLLNNQKVQGVAVASTKTDKIPEKVSVTVEKAITGSKVYAYRVNEKTGKLETIARGFTNTVDKNGKVSFTALDGGNYVVLTKKADSKLVTPLRDQIKVSASKTTVKAGNTAAIKINLPTSLELKKTLTSKTSNKAVGTTVATYKVSDSKVATIDSNGKITAKKSGKVTVTTTVKLYNKTTKTFKTTINIIK